MAKREADKKRRGDGTTDDSVEGHKMAPDNSVEGHVNLRPLDAEGGPHKARRLSRR